MQRLSDGNGATGPLLDIPPSTLTSTFSIPSISPLLRPMDLCFLLVDCAPVLAHAWVGVTETCSTPALDALSEDRLWLNRQKVL